MDYKKDIALDRLLAASGMSLVFNPDFAPKMRKKLIRSKHFHSHYEFYA